MHCSSGPEPNIPCLLRLAAVGLSPPAARHHPAPGRTALAGELDGTAHVALVVGLSQRHLRWGGAAGGVRGGELLAGGRAPGGGGACDTACGVGTRGGEPRRLHSTAARAAPPTLPRAPHNELAGAAQHLAHRSRREQRALAYLEAVWVEEGVGGASRVV